MIPYKLYLVTWIDAHSIDGWESVDGDKKNVVCESVGWLVSDTDENIVIVPHIADKGESKRDGSGKMVIPKGVIVKKREIKIK